MNKKANEQYRNNERVILSVFMKLLEKDDIQKITVNEICQDAHINRSTFYNHFRDIYDVLDKVWDLHIQETGILFSKGRHFENRRDNLRLILENMKENRLLYRVSFHSPIREKIYEGFHIIFEIHELKKKDLKDEYYLQFYEQGFLFIISYWLDGDCDLDIEDMLDILERSYIPK